MSVTLSVRCPICGQIVDIDPHDVWLVLTDEAPTPTGSYEFRCPSCKVDVSKPVDARVFAKLTAAGIRPITSRRRGGAALNEDDLIEFGRSLEGGDPWAELGPRSSLPG